MARSKSRRNKTTKTKAREQQRRRLRNQKQEKEADDLLDGLTDRQKNQVLRRLQRVKEKRNSAKKKDATDEDMEDPDPRLVDLPEDSDSWDDDSSDEDIATLVAHHKQERRQIDREYRKAAQSFRKGDLYKDENGRLTKRGDVISLTSTTDASQCSLHSNSDSTLESVSSSTPVDDPSSLITDKGVKVTKVKVDDTSSEGEVNVVEPSPPPKEKKQKTIKKSSKQKKAPIPTNLKATMDSAKAKLSSPKSILKKSKTTTGGVAVLSPSKRKFILFCKAKITIPKSDTPTLAMKKKLQSFLSTLIKIDSSLLLFKYMCKENSSYINVPAKIPDTPSKMQKFFDGRFRPAAKGTTIWPQIKIGITSDPEVFIADAKSLLEDLDMTLFLKDLQAEQTEVLGFFLFSHGRQCRMRLQETISSQLKLHKKVNELISIRWQKIVQSGGDSSSSDAKNLPTKAFHVEVIKGHGHKVTTGISYLYSSTRKKFPHNEKMRWIPYNRDVQHSSEKTKSSDIINKQKWFLKLTSFASSFEIALLDTVHESVGKSLRDLIMRMKHSSGGQLFVTVDWNWNKTSVVFVFPNAFEQESRDRIADLASFLHFRHGDLLLKKFFTPEAAERAMNAPWDDELGRAVSENDKEIDRILQETNAIDWLQPDKQNSVKVSFQEQPTEKTFFHFNPTDDSSIPTLGVHTTADDKSTTGTTDDPDDSSDEVKSHDDVVDDKSLDDHESALTDDDGDDCTVATLATKFETFKGDVDAKIDLIRQLIQNGPGRQGGTSDETEKRPSSTPDFDKEQGELPL